MDEQSDDGPKRNRLDDDRRASLPRLKCIGSFKAYTQDGEVYVIDVFTHFEAVYSRDRVRVEPGLLVLTTKDGYGVDRIAQGEYRLRDSPEISFSSNDPDAP